MPDYLPFERISYSKPEITSIAENVWIWFLTINNLPSFTDTGWISIWTIPTGYRGVFSDIIVSATFRGNTIFLIDGGDNIFRANFMDYSPVNHSFGLPPVANAGQTFYYRVYNADIITGNFWAVLSQWNVPGSKPEKPKKDDPEERFRVGDFSSCEAIFLPNGETIYMFHKRGEDKVNYLRIKDYAKKSQKILGKIHLKFEEKEEVKNISSLEPEKAVKELEKFEGSLKRKLTNFFK
jgi:hypothetical protein